MKALILGGAGEVGANLVKRLAGAPEIERLLVADADLRKAESVAADVDGDVDIEVVQCDLEDRPRLVQLATASTCLVNCTPFGYFDQVFAAALEAQVDYLDFLSEPTADHRRAAEERGIFAISGIGLSPGTSNVLCAHAASTMDGVEEFHINFASFRPIAPSRGSLDTILWELSPTCPTRGYYRDGRWVWVPPFEGSHQVDFPDPVGTQTVFIVPHTETTTLPLHFPDVRFVAVRGTWRPRIMDDVRVLNAYGLLDPVPSGDGQSTAFDATKERIWSLHGGKRASLPVWSSFITVEVVGRRGSKLCRRDYSVTHDPWGMESVGTTAGIHGAVGARMVARAGRTAAGFIDPERYFNPTEYVEALQEVHDVSISWTDRTLAADELMTEGR